jgi:membrane protein
VKRATGWVLSALAVVVALRAVFRPGTAAAPAVAIEPAAGTGTLAARARSFGNEVAGEIKEDHTTLIAASIAYYAMLAMVPALIAAISIYGLALDPDELADQIDAIADVLPGPAVDIIEDQLTQIVSTSRTGLQVGAILSIVVTLWTASGGTRAMMSGLNIAYDAAQPRPFLTQRAVAYAITLGLIVFVVTAVAVVTFLPAWLANVGLGDAGRDLISWGRWPAIFVAVTLGLGILYRIGPNRPLRSSGWLDPGALLAAVLWMLETVGFSVYVSAFGSFNATYGALGGVIVLLLWFFMSGYIILLGAQVNAVREHRRVRVRAGLA